MQYSYGFPAKRTPCISNPFFVFTKTSSVWRSGRSHWALTRVAVTRIEDPSSFVIRKTAVPFGPFMALGALVAVLWGRQIVHAWLGH